MRILILLAIFALILSAGCASNPDPRPWVEDAAREAYLQGYDRGFQDAREGREFDPHGRIEE